MSIESCFRLGKCLGKEALPIWPEAIAASATFHFKFSFFNALMFFFNSWFNHRWSEDSDALTLHNPKQTTSYVIHTQVRLKGENLTNKYIKKRTGGYGQIINSLWQILFEELTLTLTLSIIILNVLNIKLTFSEILNIKFTFTHSAFYMEYFDHQYLLCSLIPRWHVFHGCGWCDENTKANN